MLKNLVFDIKKEEIEDGAILEVAVLERQISYLADENGVNALLRHLGDSDSASCQAIRILGDSFDDSYPREPFSQWGDTHADFKDLNGALMNFDPAKRLTAHEALAHAWSAGV